MPLTEPIVYWKFEPSAFICWITGVYTLCGASADSTARAVV